MLLRAIFSILLCLYACTAILGCRHVANEQHHKDDVPLRIHLERSYTHAMAEMPDSDRDFNDEFDIDNPIGHPWRLKHTI